MKNLCIGDKSGTRIIRIVMEKSIFGFNKERSFGLLHFDTARDDPTVTYEIVTIDNEPVYQVSLLRSDLTR